MFRTVNVDKMLKHSAFRYFSVGVLAFSTDYLVLMGSFYILHLPLKISTALGFLTGFAISFTINRSWVFGKNAQRKNLARQVTEYIALIIFNLLFTIWAVSFLNDHGIKPSIGKLGVMALIMCWNYALFRWVIFAGEES
jgi:putative flippase GtrA